METQEDLFAELPRSGEVNGLPEVGTVEEDGRIIVAVATSKTGIDKEYRKLSRSSRKQASICEHYWHPRPGLKERGRRIGYSIVTGNKQGDQPE